ncbi:hypothetical protein GCM10010472_40240 [Pseudonocardia halophobica]|uniref:Uncharacterized protein n=1 Tax=Pseudonocardia halophobica TaxID=29401 RepID=A0A9W6P098_9PSEU|nr:hypothetical protein GCM10017577_65830 [Pseudonocardia halophobica]
MQSAGGSLQPAIEVENVETAFEVAALGIADAVTARSVVRRQRDRPAAPLSVHGWVAVPSGRQGP